MRRRDFIAVLGGAAAAWPLAAWAQQSAPVRRIGLLAWGDENDPAAKTLVSAFTQALADLGWTDGRNVRIDFRWHGDDINRIPAIAQELVGLRPDIIVTNATPSTAALARETGTIPIVFANVNDAVANSIVPRYDRPSGNVTGFAMWEVSMIGKWLELLSEIAPDLKRAALLFNPAAEPYAEATYLPVFEAATRALKVTPIIAPVYTDVEIETAIGALGREPGGGFFFLPDAFALGHRATIISAAARNNVPAVYWALEFAREGGLLYYGVDRVDTFRRSATYVDRILRGARPAELPVQLPTKFEIAVNRKTAKALGLAIPASILLRADEIIE
jgi:putative ABC transport system substrate-binding protein